VLESILSFEYIKENNEDEDCMLLLSDIKCLPEIGLLHNEELFIFYLFVCLFVNHQLVHRHHVLN